MDSSTELNDISGFHSASIGDDDTTKRTMYTTTLSEGAKRWFCVRRRSNKGGAKNMIIDVYQIPNSKVVTLAGTGSLGAMQKHCQCNTCRKKVNDSQPRDIP